MKAWEKAKEKYPTLSRADFIIMSCPHLLEVADKPKNCPAPRIVDKKCLKCWDREVEEG